MRRSSCFSWKISCDNSSIVPLTCSISSASRSMIASRRRTSAVAPSRTSSGSRRAWLSNVRIGFGVA